MAAGRGERMRPLTNYLHKAMIPFSGVPFLAHAIASLPRDSEVIIIVNYRWEQIAGYFGDCYKGRHIKYLRQHDPKGTGDALFQFWKAYDPKDPVIVWQADQMMFPSDVEILSKAEPNAALYSRTPAGLREIGVWKIHPSILPKLKNILVNGEYRALPVLLKEGLNKVEVEREKLEISFKEWNHLQEQCNSLRQKYPTEFP